MTSPVRDVDSKSDTSQALLPTATSTIEQELARRMVFRQLQPICTKILPLRDSAPSLAVVLTQLTAVLRNADAVGLRGCMDYALYPLLYGVDSIALTRAGELRHYVIIAAVH